MSLTLEPDDLFDYFTGIYTTGIKAKVRRRGGRGNYTSRGKEWERNAILTFFNPNKELIFSQDVGVRIHGGGSRVFNQKGFNIYARNSDYFAYNFFEEGKLNLNTFMLRNGGSSDTHYTKLRDIFNQKLMMGRRIACQDSIPCVLFLNGEYWGLYNLQERFSENYISRHYGVAGDNVIMICRSGEYWSLDVGQKDDVKIYEDILKFFAENDFSDPVKYAEACKLIDIQSFIEYLSAELYIGNVDWPKNNFRMWRARDISERQYEDGKWRFMMYDTEASANYFYINLTTGKKTDTKCLASDDSFLPSTHSNCSPLTQDNFTGLVFTKLLHNDEFRELFKSVFLEMAEKDFAYERVHKILYDLANNYAEPMTAFYRRFVSTDKEYGREYFFDKVAIIDEFFKLRKDYICDYMLKHLDNRGALTREDYIRPIPESDLTKIRLFLRFCRVNFKFIAAIVSVIVMVLMFWVGSKD